MRSFEHSLEAVDWAGLVDTLTTEGWVRLEGAVGGRACTRLVGAAPFTWQDSPDQVGRVRQAGMVCGARVDEAPPVVKGLADVIRDSINAARPFNVAKLPAFNEAQWGRARFDGSMFITPHRDPPGAGGVIAITSLYGHAPFRVWHHRADPRLTGSESAPFAQWTTADGDLVILTGRGWPHPESVCPVHEVGSPPDGERMILTLRHNRGGPGEDWL